MPDVVESDTEDELDEDEEAEMEEEEEEDQEEVYQDETDEEEEEQLREDETPCDKKEEVRFMKIAILLSTYFSFLIHNLKDHKCCNDFYSLVVHANLVCCFIFIQLIDLVFFLNPINSFRLLLSRWLWLSWCGGRSTPARTGQPTSRTFSPPPSTNSGMRLIIIAIHSYYPSFMVNISELSYTRKLGIVCSAHICLPFGLST